MNRRLEALASFLRSNENALQLLAVGLAVVLGLLLGMAMPKMGNEVCYEKTYSSMVWNSDYSVILYWDGHNFTPYIKNPIVEAYRCQKNCTGRSLVWAS
jgi:hypothetical protein